jgi:hypothetical protein
MECGAGVLCRPAPHFFSGAHNGGDENKQYTPMSGKRRNLMWSAEFGQLADRVAYLVVLSLKLPSINLCNCGAGPCQRRPRILSVVGLNLVSANRSQTVEPNRGRRVVFVGRLSWN